MAAQIEVIRGDDSIALVTIDGLSREVLLRAARMTGSGFDADTLVLSFETLASVNDPDDVAAAMAGDERAQARLNINPITGRVYEHGEMQDVVDNHDALAKGWVTEQVTIVGVNRVGDVQMACLPYHYAGGGKHLMWDEPKPAFGESVGYIPDALAAGMQAPSASQLYGVVFPEQALDRDKRDIATVKYLQNNRIGAAILFADADQQDRLRALRRNGFRHF